MYLKLKNGMYLPNFYNKEGVLVKEEIYKNGELIEIKEY